MKNYYYAKPKQKSSQKAIPIPNKSRFNEIINNSPRAKVEAKIQSKERATTKYK